MESWCWTYLAYFCFEIILPRTSRSELAIIRSAWIETWTFREGWTAKNQLLWSMLEGIHFLLLVVPHSTSSLDSGTLGSICLGTLSLSHMTPAPVPRNFQSSQHAQSHPPPNPSPVPPSLHLSALGRPGCSTSKPAAMEVECAAPQSDITKPSKPRDRSSRSLGQTER